MRLTFEYTQNLGQGLTPQCLHMMDNAVKVIYITADGMVKVKETYPPLGIYSNLSFKEKGRMAADLGVSKPSLKKVAHYGAYGFWSSDGK